MKDVAKWGSVIIFVMTALFWAYKSTQPTMPTPGLIGTSMFLLFMRAAVTRSRED